MGVVVDASIALKWVIPESDQPQAVRLRDRLRESNEEILVPPIFIAEIVNALYQQVRKGAFTVEQARKAYGLLDLAVSVRPHTQLAIEALELAAATRLPATYDAFYLALARLEECALWTADQQLARAAQATAVDVHSLQDI